MKRLYDRREAPSEPAPVALVRAWWDCAGEGLARAARPTGVADGKLEVVVADLRWQRQIEDLRDVLLARLRRRKGCENLAGIRVLVEPSAGGMPRAEGGESVSGPLRAPEEIRRAAQSIEDPELGRRWCEAVSRHLRRRDSAKPPR